MSFMLPSSINLVEYSGRSWSDIKFVEKDGDTSAKSVSSPESKSTRLLPRTDHPLFGLFPKLDSRVLFECGKCGKVLLPSVFQAHCANPEHEAMVPISQQPPPAPVGKASSRSRKAATKPAATASSNVVVPIPPPPIAPQPAPPPTTTSNGRASKHKKSGKSNKRSRNKEEKSEPVAISPAAAAAAATLQSAQDVDAHIHPTKVSKHDAEHMVAVPYSIPDTHLFAASLAGVAPVDSLPPEMLVDVGTADEIETVTTSYTSVDDALATTYIHMESTALEEHDAHQLHTISIGGEQIDVQVQMKVVEEMVEMEPEEVRQMIRAVEEQVHEEEMLVVQDVGGVVEETVVSSGSVTAIEEEAQEQEAVDHMPMSPVAVVNIVPVQNYQYLQQYLHLPTQPIVVTIPCSSSSSHHMYASYPKPLTVSTRAMRKIGGTYLLQNQRMDHQRAEIQALTRSRHALNHLPT